MSTFLSSVPLAASVLLGRFELAPDASCSNKPEDDDSVWLVDAGAEAGRPQADRLLSPSSLRLSSTLDWDGEAGSCCTSCS